MFLGLFLLSQNKKLDEFDDDNYYFKRMEQLQQKAQYEWEKVFRDEKEFNKLNILVIGRPGSGKSTLINHVLRGNYALTGIGKSKTQDIDPITKDNSPILFYDSPGLELDPKSQKKLKNDIINLIKKNHKTKDPRNYIHCIWYCVSHLSERFEDYEIQFIKQICRNPSIGNIPFFLIITQCYRKNETDKFQKEDEFIEKLKNESIESLANIPILSKEKVFNDENKKDPDVFRPYGINIIYDEIEKHLPKILNETSNNIKIASSTYKQMINYFKDIL